MLGRVPTLCIFDLDKSLRTSIYISSTARSSGGGTVEKFFHHRY
ncbi:hypothetical protein M7I_5514 [Glarea lozoyensis 74030]|uniref:Uncharacterized protein n=1 Tax=Glarea lozoyensis (strain ATCC 74030 / MF5533) TaxID=1104152 RepID=H0ES39_GLAL7|nr:hypothetical protein M7I_5514 [Glarea lozoyensis 74030]